MKDFILIYIKRFCMKNGLLNYNIIIYYKSKQVVL